MITRSECLTVHFSDGLIARACCSLCVLTPAAVCLRSWPSAHRPCCPALGPLYHQGIFPSLASLHLAVISLVCVNAKIMAKVIFLSLGDKSPGLTGDLIPSVAKPVKFCCEATKQLCKMSPECYCSVRSRTILQPYGCSLFFISKVLPPTFQCKFIINNLNCMLVLNETWHWKLIAIPLYIYIGF